MAKLTATGIRNLSTPGKYGDGNGLFLVVAASGAKRWVQRITIRGKRCDLGLGPLSSVSLAEARELAARNRKEALAGGDPLRDKREAAAVMTFEEAAREVHRLHLPTWRNVKHGKDFITSLEMYAFPRIGHIRVSDVTAADVLGVLTPIWTVKHETARRVRQRIGTVLKWAVAKGWRQDNPADAITTALPKVPKVQAHRVALPYDKVADFLTALRGCGAMPQTRWAIEFLILTAMRSLEVRDATWDEIDLDAATWTIPADRMKMKRPHRVPLSPRAVAILKEARALFGGTGRLFPGMKKGRPLSDVTLSKTVKGLGFPVDIHGFRTSFRTWAQEKTGFPREVAEASLAHLVGSEVERAYSRSDLFDKRRRLMNAWAAYVTNESTGKVVRIA
ncbi:tyrosine-type recombinase/integrase [Paracoccus alkenifer]|uniref:Integrase n=1 Tax=Paracoccus alkenifer TaxID=65735 RepID=A0A1H6MGJ9_9RHOB|nr:integrase arm-type DNA-binding domain-containing protein [Paracoccus alkenifer]SEH96704.1 Integrase [Paracoccus alkenifer]